MKKQFIVALIIIIVLAAAGGYYFVKSKPAGTMQSENAPAAQNVFTSIKDALSKSLSLSCNFTDESGRKIQSYIKGGAIRADITAEKPEEAGSVIVKDKKVYFWNDKNAFVMEMKDTEVTPGAQVTPEAGSESSSQDIMGTMEKYKSSCKPAVVDDSLFTPPATVKFQDLSKMMPSGIPAMPSAAAAPSINAQNYQQYMQQYQQNQPAQ